VESRQSFKGGLLRGYAKWLRDNGQLDGVLAKAPNEVRAALLDPPLVSEWVPGHVQNAALEAVVAHGGEAMVRAMIRGSVRTGVLKFIEPLIQGYVRMFGRTPDIVLSRFEALAKTTVRGLVFRYEPIDGRSGALVTTSDNAPLGPYSPLAWATAIEVLCELIGFDKTKVTYEMTPDRMRSRVLVRW
jgi:hypothetical protein